MKQLMSHSRPLVGHMTEDNQLSVYHDRPLLVGYMDLSWDLHAKSALQCNIETCTVNVV